MLFANLTSVFRSTLFRLACLFMLVFFIAAFAVFERTDEAIEEYFEDKAFDFGNELLIEKLGFLTSFGADALTDEIEILSVRNPESREIYVLLNEACEVVAGAPERLPPSFLNEKTCERMTRTGGKQIFNLSREFSGISIQSSYERSNSRADDAVAIYQQLPTGEALLVVMIAPEAEEARDFMDRTLAWTFLLLFSGGLIGAIFLTLTVSRKLEKVNLMSRDIRQGDLSRRIPLNNSGDEFDNLSINLNAMLDRIEFVLEGSKQVTNDIAHDLRTPLTRIQTRIESLKASLEDDNESLIALENIANEATALLEMFNSLLRIAGVESGGSTSSFTELDWSHVCEDAIELLEPLAADKQISLKFDIEKGLIAKGDKNLLFHSATNIIENAIKYSPAKTEIVIRLRRHQDYHQLVVSDQGPGIPEGEIANVFMRFYRLESHRSTEGYGLGLSLVKAVFDLHQGSITIKNGDEGLDVLATLPIEPN